MRLFVAIPLSAEVRQELQKLQQPVDGVSWQVTEQLHLTLRFIGDVKRQTASEVDQRLSSIRFSRFELNTNGLGYFPPGGRPRVLWMGVEKNPLLVKLQQEVEKACQDAGLQPESRKYIPHITLGKVKGASGKTVKSFIEQHQQLDPNCMDVNEFVLYSSRLHSSGAVHTPKERYLTKTGTS